MPNVKSAQKRLKTSQRRRTRNRAVRSTMRKALRDARTALGAGDEQAAKAALPRALSLIGRSAKKGIIHKRTAARLQSRLTKRANALSAEPSGN